MSPDVTPPPAESLPVQLTRMEGKFDLLSARLGDLSPRVDRHEVAIGDLTLKVQRLDDGATSSQATVVATAKALREAKEAQEATARAEAEKSDQSWSPAARLATILGAVAVLWTLLSNLLPG